MHAPNFLENVPICDFICQYIPITVSDFPITLYSAFRIKQCIINLLKCQISNIENQIWSLPLKYLRRSNSSGQESFETISPSAFKQKFCSFSILSDSTGVLNFLANSSRSCWLHSPPMEQILTDCNVFHFLWSLIPRTFWMLSIMESVHFNMPSSTSARIYRTNEWSGTSMPSKKSWGLLALGQ